VVNLGKKLEVVSVDLAHPPAEILVGIRLVADRIRHLRDKALRQRSDAA
jgi:hypothetical protein